VTGRKSLQMWRCGPVGGQRDDGVRWLPAPFVASGSSRRTVGWSTARGVTRRRGSGGGGSWRGCRCRRPSGRCPSVTRQHGAHPDLAERRRWPVRCHALRGPGYRKGLGSLTERRRHRSGRMTARGPLVQSRLSKPRACTRARGAVRVVFTILDFSGERYRGERIRLRRVTAGERHAQPAAHAR
jgi:hypothetical protein